MDKGIRLVWGFANNIIRSARKLVNEELRLLNLSSAEGNILQQLLTQGEGVRQEDIVGRLDISKPAVSRALDSLEGKGYVARKKDPGDKRASLVFLTDKARGIGPQVEDVYETVFSAAAEGLSEEEILGFAQLFGRVSENLSRARRRD